MYYLVYKITNTINGKIYIGCHKTIDINDDYMGSGTLLKRAQEKYGIKNFTKEILEVFDNPDDMFQMESQLVNEDFIKRDDTYNLKEGGYGGFDYVNSTGKNLYYDENGNCLNGNVDNLIKEGRTKKEMIELGIYDDYLQKCSKTWKNKYENGYENPFKGKKHSNETINKLKGHNRQNGEKNSQYRTMWVYNQETLESKKIKGDIPDGWKRGKKLPKKVSKYKTFSYKLKKIFKKIKKSNLQKQKRIKAEELIRKESEYYQKLFDDYINSDFKSMREFVKKTNYEFSHVTLTKKFKKYITDYNKIIKPFTTKK